VKVAFIGTHGVGKTTLCFDLASRLKRLDLSVDIVKEVARDCPLPINQDTNYEAQAWILHTQCAREIASTFRFQAVVCDRAVIDNYAYLVHQVGKREELERFVRGWTQTYAGLFKVPLWRPPQYDGTRDVNPGFQREIDALLDRLLVDFEVRHVRLPAGERGDWIRLILHELGLPEEPPQIELFSE
jgi:predicted ATPase